MTSYLSEFGSINSIVEDAISLDLGNPAFMVSEKEQGLKNSAIRLGLMDYYRCWPYRITYAQTYGMENGAPMKILVEDVLAQGNPTIPDEQQKYFYFLGMMRAHKPSMNTWSNPGNWNNQLLGAASGYYVGSTTSSSAYTSILGRLAMETYEHLSTADGPRYDYDRANGVITLVPPFGIGQLIFDIGFGSTNLEYVEPSKVDWLCTFISYRLIESLVQARSGIKLSADFEISVEALNNRLNYLREKVDKIKKLSYSHIAQWG